VHQRVSLRQRGADDHEPQVLIMTATPIPRTLSLTLYGDLDVSVLDEMPAGRTPVVTQIVANGTARARAYDEIRAAIAQGRQAFIICPLVEGSANVEAKAAESEFERIQAEVFPELRVGLVHGRLKSNMKDEVMQAFREGALDILVATTVVEVGVDIPNATHMIIEDADRFGLSQLHQLRGRIGRGSESGICYLFTAVDPEDESRAEAMRRLRAMEETTDGFALAELDLEQRGTGQIFGRDAADGPAQTGRSDLRFANLLRDTELLLEARAAAFALVDTDPTLDRQEHAALVADVRRRFAGRLDWIFAS
jgi:ATP-dependent DNA helicase RecG